MPRKKKEHPQLSRLEGFFISSAPGLRQNGAGGPRHATGLSLPGNASHTPDTRTAPRGPTTWQVANPDSGNSSSGSSTPPSPSSRSPAKARPRRDSPPTDSAYSPMEQSAVPTPPPALPADPFAAFHPGDQPVSASLLKDMLHTLWSSIHKDMLHAVSQTQREVHHLGGRVDAVEASMDKCTLSFNTLVTAHNGHAEDISWLKDKVADLEDRSRRNNLKLRGVPESVQQQHLEKMAKELFAALVPSLSESDLTIDRIHRIPKPSFIAADQPRDLLLRVHFFQSKDKILMAARQLHNLPGEFPQVQILPDLSRHTLQKRRNLATITKALRNHHILHKWKHPAHLSITHNGSTVTISTLEEGISLLRRWGIILDQSPHPSPQQDPQHLSTDWQIVSRKRSSSQSPHAGGEHRSLPTS